MTGRRERACFALLLVGYLISRLWALTAFPAFIDEAIHIESARETLQGKLLAGSWAGRWLSIKLMAVFVALPIHPLLGARLSAALAGLGALTACVLLGRRLYTPAVGLVAGFVYLVLPYALFYNRLALAETFAAALAGAVLTLSVVAVGSTGRRDVAVLALALACMFLAKFYTVALALVPLTTIVLLAPRSTWRVHFARMSPALVPVALLFGAMVWRGHGIHYVGEQSVFGGGSPHAALVWRNLGRVSAWLWTLVTPSLTIAFLLALASQLPRSRKPADALLAAAFALGVVPFILAAQIWFPRYLAPVLVPLCVLMARYACTAAAAVSACSRGSDRGPRAGLVAVAAVILAWPLWFDGLIILHPEQAPMPRIERGEFFEGTGAGDGVPELAAYLRGQSLASTEGIDVVRFSFWNQANQGLSVYLSPTASLALHTIDPTAGDAPATIARIAAQRRSFFVLNPPSEAGHLAAMGKSLGEYFQSARRAWYHPRPGGKSALEAWELRPSPPE